MDRIAAMTAFVRIVELGSLSAAARSLGGSLPAVSRQLALLEDGLSARLLTRTTRRQALTEAGQAYYARAKRILDDVDDAERAVGSLQSEPAGRLAVAAPVLFGREHIAAAVAEFLVRHPRIEIDLTLADRFVNLVEEGVDVAVRIGDLADSSLVARRLGRFRRVVCASPDYLARRGRPRHPDDLAGHDCIAFTMLAEPSVWTFTVDGHERRVPVTARLRANNADAVLAAALAGGGLALAPTWQIGAPVRAGHLVALLDRYASAPTPIHALYPQGRLLSAKVRAFVDFLAARFVDFLAARFAGADFDALPRARRAR